MTMYWGRGAFYSKKLAKNGGLFLTMDDELDELRKMSKTKYEIYS